MIDIISVRQPWWSAWKRFGWVRKTPGVGIKKDVLRKAKDEKRLLLFRIGKDEQIYELNAARAWRYARKHKTFYLAKFGTLLYVVPLAFLIKSSYNKAWPEKGKQHSTSKA